MFLPKALLELQTRLRLPLPSDLLRFLASRPQGRAFPGLFCYNRAWVISRWEDLDRAGNGILLPFARNEAGRELAVRLDTGAVVWTDAPSEILHDSFPGFVADQNEQKRRNIFPLNNAARRGELEKIDRLIRRGRDINAIDSRHCTPLMAALLNWQFDAAHLLLGHHPDLSIANRAGENALMFACLRNRIELVTRMLDAGADPNAQTGTGAPVLHFATIGCYDLNSRKAWGSLEIVQLLVARGANPVAAWQGRDLISWMEPESDPAIRTWLVQKIDELHPRS